MVKNEKSSTIFPVTKNDYNLFFSLVSKAALIDTLDEHYVEGNKRKYY